MEKDTIQTQVGQLLSIDGSGLKDDILDKDFKGDMFLHENDWF